MTVVSPSLWRGVWQRKARQAMLTAHGRTLRTLMEIGGHTSSLGGVTPATLRASAARFRRELAVPAGGSLLDIGCGAGAVFYAMRPRPATMVGVDFSAASLALARQALPQARFMEGEADALPVESGRFDGALSCGVVIYFPDLDFTRRALAEMVRVLRPGGRGLLLDLMDAAHRERREARRRAGHPPGEYDRLYADLRHLYLDPDWVSAELAALGCRSWPVEDPFGADYGYRDEAFHVAFETAS